MRSGVRIAGGMAVGLLANGDVDTLEAMTEGRFLSAGELRAGVEALGLPVVRTPAGEWSHVPVSPSGGDRSGFDFVAPLWTVEGRSGFGMAMRLIPTTYGTFEAEIDGFVPLDVDALPDASLVLDAPTPAGFSGGVGGGDGPGSEDPVPERWRPALREIIDRLVGGDYAGLAADGLVAYTDDPTDASIGQWIEEYPATLVAFPEKGWEYSSYSPWVNEPGSWWVVVDLWTAEEGRSDLSMEATIRDDGNSIVAKVDNVHVM